MRWERLIRRRRWGAEERRRKLGGKRYEALFNRGGGRFRESHRHSRPAESDAKAPRNRLQALQGDSFAMAKGQQNGSCGSQLSASSGYRAPGQSSLFNHSVKYTTERIAQPR